MRYFFVISHHEHWYQNFKTGGCHGGGLYFNCHW
jgi:hypothetical protein